MSCKYIYNLFVLRWLARPLMLTAESSDIELCFFFRYILNGPPYQASFYPINDIVMFF